MKKLLLLMLISCVLSQSVHGMHSDNSLYKPDDITEQDIQDYAQTGFCYSNIGEKKACDSKKTQLLQDLAVCIPINWPTHTNFGLFRLIVRSGLSLLKIEPTIRYGYPYYMDENDLKDMIKPELKNLLLTVKTNAEKVLNNKNTQEIENEKKTANYYKKVSKNLFGCFFGLLGLSIVGAIGKSSTFSATCIGLSLLSAYASSDYENKALDLEDKVTTMEQPVKRLSNIINNATTLTKAGDIYTIEISL